MFAKDELPGGGGGKGNGPVDPPDRLEGAAPLPSLPLLQPNLTPQQISAAWGRLKAPEKLQYVEHFVSRGMFNVAAGVLQRASRSEDAQRTSVALRMLAAVDRGDLLQVNELTPELVELDIFDALLIGDNDRPWANWAEFQDQLRTCREEVAANKKWFVAANVLLDAFDATLERMASRSPAKPPDLTKAYHDALGDGRRLAGTDLVEKLLSLMGNLQNRAGINEVQGLLHKRLQVLHDQSPLSQAEANLLAGTTPVSGARPKSDDVERVREQLARFFRLTGGRGAYGIGEVNIVLGSRAHYDTHERAIRLGSVLRTLELWHEGGHAVTEESKSASRAQTGFVRARRDSGQQYTLRSLTGRGYGSDEVAVSGDARDPYVLKGDGDEVVSMGTGDLVSPSLAAGATEDPEQFFLTLSVLRGASY